MLDKKVTFIIAIMAVAIIILSAIIYCHISPRRPEYEWFFKGAYALYRGEGTGLLIGLPGMASKPMTIREVMLLEVLDYNSTHVKVILSENVTFNSIPAFFSIEGYNGDWIALGKEFKLQAQVLRAVNESEIHVEDLGTRRVIVYEGRITAYVDEGLWWPVMLRDSEHFHMNYDVYLQLVKTNIPELMGT
jgi:hypothetical protein